MDVSPKSSMLFVPFRAQSRADGAFHRSTHLLPPPAASDADRWTARAVAEGFWRGWGAGIDSMSAVLGEKRGQRRFSSKANSRPISSGVLSGDPFTFSPFSSPPTLSCVCPPPLPVRFIPLKATGKKAKKNKNKVDKGCPLSSQQGWWGGGGTDSSPEDRPESPDVPQCP